MPSAITDDLKACCWRSSPTFGTYCSSVISSTVATIAINYDSVVAFPPAEDSLYAS